MGMKTITIATILLAATAAGALAGDDDDRNGRKQSGLKVDTEHIFGFTEGADIGDVGDKEIEKETSVGFGKRMGLYAASSTLLDFKYVPLPGVLISPGLLLSYHGIAGVPGFDDRQQIGFQGLSFEMKYQLLDRNHAQFGLTLFAQPRWTRIDEANGERVSQFSSEFTLALDKEILPQRLFGAFNLIYEPEISRSHETGGRSGGTTISSSTLRMRASASKLASVSAMIECASCALR